MEALQDNTGEKGLHTICEGNIWGKHTNHENAMVEMHAKNDFHP
eukprot:SAG11_NODE_3041_length_2739_cov_20.274242_2_plen_44_part_00